MAKNFKRSIAMLLVLNMLSGMIPAQALADGDAPAVQATIVFSSSSSSKEASSSSGSSSSESSSSSSSESSSSSSSESSSSSSSESSSSSSSESSSSSSSESSSSSSESSSSSSESSSSSSESSSSSSESSSSSSESVNAVSEGSDSGDDGSKGTVEVETSAGNKETVEVTEKSDATNNDDGSTTVKTESSAEGFVTESGANVDYKGESEMTTDADGLTTGSASTEYDVYTDLDNGGYYEAQGGSELEQWKEFDPTLSDKEVDIPLTDEEGKNTNTVEGDKQETEYSGDLPESSEDGTYDYTQETIEQPGSVTVTTTEIKIEESIGVEGTDLEYVKAQEMANAENDMFISAWEREFSNDLIGETQTDPENEDVAKVEGYDYSFVGQGNSSQFYAAFMYKTPAIIDGVEEEPSYIDPETGTKYYTHRGKLTNWHYKVEGIYQDGEMADENASVGTIWGNVAQYMLVDVETGELITTYCADQTTPTQDGYGYNIENVEDGTYYSDAEAAMIRTVAKNGYWGVLDDETTEEAEYGSLESVKNMMREAKDADGNAVFTEDEINSLTDGAAMTATQYAIWTFSNKMTDVVFVNTHFIAKDENNEANGYSYAHLSKYIPEDKKDDVDLIFKLYNHLINMEPDVIEEKTTENTIINADNFISDMTVTVIEKVDDHENNNDDDTHNDAYTTNLSFALVVTPDKETDKLLVKVIDAQGNEIASGRIAGELQDGETQLNADDDGNYTFTGITMIEGEQNFNLTIEGVQHLKEGVYLYSSEIRNVEGEDVASQTMVGIASGDRAVNVSMNISFELDVDDRVVAREHVYRDEHDPIYPPQDPPPPALYRITRGVGQLEIIDEEVPLAEPPQTGDISMLWFAMVLVSGLGLCVLNLKKREEA